MNQNQNPQIENNDLTFCPSFNCYSSSAASAIKISTSLPNQDDDLYHDNEFNFVIEDNKSSPTTTIYPLFNQKENVCDTLQNLFITEREDDTSSSDEEGNENENEPVFCVWRGSTKSDTSSSSSVALTKCKKSSSTGSGSGAGSGSGSKRWCIRDLLLRRSNSEGKDQQPISNILLTQHSNNKKVVEAVAKQKRNSVECSLNNGRTKPSSPSVHEIFYVQNRAKTEDGKRRSYLPYRQGLVGFFSRKIL